MLSLFLRCTHAYRGETEAWGERQGQLPIQHPWSFSCGVKGPAQGPDGDVAPLLTMVPEPAAWLLLNISSVVC